MCCGKNRKQGSTSGNNVDPTEEALAGERSDSSGGSEKRLNPRQIFNAAPTGFLKRSDMRNSQEFHSHS